MAYKWTPPRNSGGIPQVSTRFSLSMEMSRLTRDGTAEPSHETKLSGTNFNADGEIFIFPVQLTTSRIGNLTRLIHTLAIYVMCDNTYIHACLVGGNPTMNTPRLRRGGGITSSFQFHFFTCIGTPIEVSNIILSRSERRVQPLFAPSRT